MFWLKRKRHLKYSSIEEWMKFEKIPPPSEIKAPALIDQCFSQLGELRQHLFDKHLATLTREEQQLLKSGKHPSQNHELLASAKPVLDRFKMELSGVDAIEKVELGLYHLNRIIISVHLKQGTDIVEIRKSVPPFYGGFEVLCGIPSKQD